MRVAFTTKAIATLAVAWGGIALGASTANAGDTPTAADKPIVLAQASRCRDDEVYRPRNQRSDRFGCVNKRFVERLTEEERGDPLIQSGHSVVPDKCDGRYDGGLCQGGFYKDVSFAEPFESPPHVLVSIEEASYQGSCVGGATDKVVSFPTKITRSGFRLYAYGSPVSGSCGSQANWASRAKAGWLAIGIAGEDDGRRRRNKRR